MKALLLKILMYVLEAFISEEVLQQIKVYIVEWLREQALKTDNDLDDKVVDIIARFLGVADEA